MLSLVEVRCPHCGALGQLMLPPLGAIIVGPCPHCHEFLVVFCGHALPLDKDIVQNGTPEEKQQHLLDALMGFLDEQLTELIGRAEESRDSLDTEPVFGERDALVNDPEEDVSWPLLDEVTAISDAEVADFVNSELPGLDRGDYFRDVFEE
jgi:hypothetical protein